MTARELKDAELLPWLSKERPRLEASTAAWLLVESSDYVGFGVLTAAGPSFPPGVTLDWTRALDLRAFGSKGECHAVRLGGDRWRARTALLEDIAEGERIERQHLLWGTGRASGEARDGWFRYDEARGTGVELPVAVDALPLRLRVVERVGTDERTGLAGVVDALVVGLCDGAGRPLAPRLPGAVVSAEASMTWLLSSFSLSMLGDAPSAKLAVERLDVTRASELARDAQVAVGHEDTARLFGELLGRPVERRREHVTLRGGDRAVVGQYLGARLPEGATTLPEGARVAWYLVQW